MHKGLIGGVVSVLALGAYGCDKGPDTAPDTAPETTQETTAEAMSDTTPKSAPANEETVSGTIMVEEFKVAEDAGQSCPVLDSRNWQAWINAMPGPDAKPMLHITGEADLPTPGFGLELVAGPADRSATPTQRFRLSATPPSGMVTQVVTTESISFEDVAMITTYKALIILCGDETLAEITDIPVVQ